MRRLFRGAASLVSGIVCQNDTNGQAFGFDENNNNSCVLEGANNKSPSPEALKLARPRRKIAVVRTARENGCEKCAPPGETEKTLAFLRGNVKASGPPAGRTEELGENANINTNDKDHDDNANCSSTTFAASSSSSISCSQASSSEPAFFDNLPGDAAKACKKAGSRSSRPPSIEFTMFAPCPPAPAARRIAISEDLVLGRRLRAGKLFSVWRTARGSPRRGLARVYNQDGLRSESRSNLRRTAEDRCVSATPEREIYFFEDGRQRLNAACQTYAPFLALYDFKEELGTGAFGSVWRAADCDGVERTVKMEKVDCRSHAAAESAALQRLRGTSGVVQGRGFVAARTAAGRPSYSLIECELIEGVDLKRDNALAQMRQSQQLDEMRRIGRELLITLAKLHQRHIVHRDIKLRNIMLTRGDRRPILIDFGFAGFGLSGHKEMLSTLEYAAPEVVRKFMRKVPNETYDYRADIFALGATLFTYFYGRHVREALPGQRDRWPENVKPPFPKPRTPAEAQLQDLLRNMLRNAPEQRYSVAECLAHHFFAKKK